MTSAIVAVAEATDVAEARRRGADVARALGFDEVAAGRVAIAVTESATNLLKHAGGGDMFLGVATDGQRRGVQIVAMDRSHGIEHLAASLADGVSTAGTAGTGLGAIRRSSDSFDVYTSSTGTVLAATVYASGATVKGSLPIGAVCVPLQGERECGDAWAVWSAGELTSVFLCDGLGHGSGAAAAANAAVKAFHRYAERSAPEVLAAVHDALKPTRGAAVALAELDARRGTLQYCGVGNIAAVIARPDGTDQHLVSLSGISGHLARRIRAFHYDWPRGSVLVMHTDGVGTHWSLSRYEGLRLNRPDVVAGVIFRDHRRGRDDATALVAMNAEAA